LDTDNKGVEIRRQILIIVSVYSSMFNISIIIAVSNKAWSFLPALPFFIAQLTPWDFPFPMVAIRIILDTGIHWDRGCI
jgi:hypothetical protein